MAEEDTIPVEATPDPTTSIQLLRQRSPGSDWLELSPAPEDPGNPDSQKEAEAKAKRARTEIDEYLQSVLTTPNLVVLAGSGCSHGNVGGPSMGDLWSKAKEIEGFGDARSYVKHPENDEWIENLLSRCQLAKDFLDEAGGKTVAEFLTAAESMIWKECSGFLKDANLEGHKTFLRRMARRRMRAPRLKVFTTNYDLCFEAAASAIGITPIDGFSFTHPRRFDPRFFAFDIVRRAKSQDETHDFVEGVFQLLKIHGSVDWDVDDGMILQNVEPKTPCLVYPASSKYEQSYSQPHLEIMAQFQGILREPNTCLVTVGFGFNDNHLTAPILAAADSNPSLRLLVVDRSAKSKSEDGTSAFSDIADLICRGEAEIALLQAEFKQFAELIPQLRALSPAEQFAKNVRCLSKDS
jgi:hypothetical protein